MGKVSRLKSVGCLRGVSRQRGGKASVDSRLLASKCEPRTYDRLGGDAKYTRTRGRGASIEKGSGLEAEEGEWSVRATGRGDAGRLQWDGHGRERWSWERRRWSSRHWPSPHRRGGGRRADRPGHAFSTGSTEKGGSRRGEQAFHSLARARAVMWDWVSKTRQARVESKVRQLCLSVVMVLK